MVGIMHTEFSEETLETRSLERLMGGQH